MSPSSISPTRSSAIDTAIERPAGGFFLWLDVSAHGGDEAATVKLWRDGGLRVIPGHYLARNGADGRNPGTGYIRVALVSDRETTAEALHRLVPYSGDPAMSALDRGFDFASLSDDLRNAVRRRLREGGGLALILLAVLATVALATWSVQDPSLSHATNAPVRNLLGVPGAIAADLLMQLFGLAAVALVLPVAIWGWRLMTHRPLERERLRIALWICGAVVGAGFAACLPRGLSWPLPTGLGGVIGDALLRVPGVLTGSVSGKRLLSWPSCLG